MYALVVIAALVGQSPDTEARLQAKALLGPETWHPAYRSEELARQHGQEAYRAALARRQRYAYATLRQRQAWATMTMARMPHCTPSRSYFLGR